MTKYLVEESTLTDIADAIREQTGDENPIMLSNFASEIGSIQGGGSVNYSTTEHEIGTWIDGSPLYEITLTNTANANATNSGWSSVSWANEPSDIDVLVSAELNGSNGNSVPNLWNTLRFGMDGGHVKIASLQNGALNANSHVTIRYTKTQSSLLSMSPSEEENENTEEVEENEQNIAD